MSLETLLIWILVGLISGWLASTLVGGGYGLLGNVVIGVVGSFTGGVIFRGLHIHAPIAGLAGTIFVAFVGAIALLIVLRLLRPSGAGGR